MRSRLILAFLALTVGTGICYAAEGEAQHTWWGLWNTAHGTSTSATLEGSNDLYVRLTAQNSALLVGGSISGLRFFISDKTAVTALSVWIAARYSNGPQTVTVQRDVPLSALRDMQHDGLPTEVSLEGDIGILPAGNAYANILVGLSIQVAGGRAMPLLTGSVSGPSGSCFLNSRDMSSAYGALPLQVLGCGPLLPAEGATPMTIGEQVEMAGQPATLTLPVSNSGAAAVTDVAYIVSIDGEPQPEQFYQLPATVDELGMVFDMPVSYTTPATPQEHQLSITLTRVNGQPIGSAPQSTNLVTLARKPTKRSVMEEFTGTWCHNCIRGIAGIELLQELFGEQFIPIAMHSDDLNNPRDPMIVPQYRNSTFYREKQRVLGGLPSCTIDRWIDCDPYCGMATTGSFATDQLVAYALQRTAVADIAVEAQFTNTTEISCDIATHFAYNSSDAHYSLITVLTADSLTGQGNQWRQSNGYNDYAGPDAALLAYAGRGAYLYDMVYNHVAIDIMGVDGGISGSISTPLRSDAPQHYACTFNIGGNALVQHPDKLNLVVMLTDTRDGSVVNAAVAHVKPFGSSDGISETVSRQPAPHHYYDLQGRRLQARPQSKGIYIAGGRKYLRRSDAATTQLYQKDDENQ